MQPGDVYCDPLFYRGDDGVSRAKYMLILAMPAGDDIVARLLTSRAHGRPERPPCFHGLPYPGYYLGVLPAPLGRKTWLDLRYLADLESSEVQRMETRSELTRVLSLARPTLRNAIECVAAADDTTGAQERRLRDTLSTLC